MIPNATDRDDYCGQWYGNWKYIGRVPSYTDDPDEQVKIQEDTFRMYFDWLQTLPEPYYDILLPRKTAQGSSSKVFNRSSLIVWMNVLYDLCDPVDVYELMAVVTEKIISDYNKLITGYRCMRKCYEDKKIYDRPCRKVKFTQMHVDDISCDL